MECDFGQGSHKRESVEVSSASFAPADAKVVFFPELIGQHAARNAAVNRAGLHEFAQLHDGGVDDVEGGRVPGQDGKEERVSERRSEWEERVRGRTCCAGRAWLHAS